MKDTTMPRVGIGIVTYNRREVLAATIDKVRRLTRHPDVNFVVADDGSTDGTLAWLRTNNVPVIGGVNMGIAWNKNRALFLLSEMLRCEVVILLEDDTQPAAAGWDGEWIDAAQRWGHVNYAGPWMKDQFMAGKGTAADPVLSKVVTAQCASYSSRSLLFGGYYDSRFKGYGHEHVEHTRRLIRVGFGGTDEFMDGEKRVVFKLIDGGVTVIDVPSYFNQADIDRNLDIARPLMSDQSYRAPWRDDSELKQFRSELHSALEGRPAGFSLRGNPRLAAATLPGFGGRLRRLFGGSPLGGSPRSTTKQARFNP